MVCGALLHFGHFRWRVGGFDPVEEGVEGGDVARSQRSP